MAENTDLTFSATPEQHEKLACLESYFKELGSAAVAFSGGVDSSFLLFVAHKVLGERALAVTAEAALTPSREKSDSKEFCDAYGIKRLTFNPDVLANQALTANPPDRCYICKKVIFSGIFDIAQQNGIAHVAEGSNTSDEGDFRPGFKAITELGALSPLRTCGFSKQDIRDLSQELGLPTWDKPSCACLASRIAYNEQITAEKLEAIDEAENVLIANGVSNVRVRIEGNDARIEVSQGDFRKVINGSTRYALLAALKRRGFNRVTLDLEGYKTGSMNAGLSASELMLGKAN